MFETIKTLLLNVSKISFSIICRLIVYISVELTVLQTNLEKRKKRMKKSAKKVCNAMVILY